MNPLYMLELQFDAVALERFLHTHGLRASEDDATLSYGIHAWLGAAFGDVAPKPWRLLMDAHRPPRLLGYGACDAEALRQRITEFAEPCVLRVCPEPQSMIDSRAMPTWREGRRLGFQLLVCPTGRKAASGIEKDLFLICADGHEGDDGLSREKIYCDWAKQKLSDHSVTVESMRLAGFRLVKQGRQTQPSDGRRLLRTVTRPHVLLEGDLTVGDPDEFTRLLRHGVGRHRAFGYGMILLRPRS